MSDEHSNKSDGEFKLYISEKRKRGHKAFKFHKLEIAFYVLHCFRLFVQEGSKLSCNEGSTKFILDKLNYVYVPFETKRSDKSVVNKQLFATIYPKILVP